MKYTKEIPTKPGWYWVRYLGLKNARIVRAFQLGNQLNFVMGGGNFRADNRFEYAGPIPEPEE